MVTPEHEQYLFGQPRKEINASLKTDDIEGARPRNTLKVAGIRRGGFFPGLPQIEAGLVRDKPYGTSGVASMSAFGEDPRREVGNYKQQMLPQNIAQ
jgi:hypothetical protein